MVCSCRAGGGWAARLAGARLCAAVLLLWAAPGAAQEPAQPTPETPAPADDRASPPESAETPAEPALPDVATLPGLVEQELDQLEEERALRQDLTQIDPIRAQLPEALIQLSERDQALEEQLGRARSLDALLGIERGYGPLRDTLQNWDETISQRIERTGVRGAALQTRQQRWERAREAVQRDGAPAVVLEAVDRARRAVEAEASATRELRDQLLALQAEVTAAREQLDLALGRVASARQQVLSQLWVRSAPPLWRMQIQPPGGAPFAERLREQLNQQREGLVRLYTQESERGLLQLLLFAALCLALRGARTRGRTWRTDASVPDQVSAVFEHPFAIAFLVALLVTPWFYASAPQAAIELSELLMLFPALAVIRPLTPGALRPALFALAGFYVLDQLRDLASGLPAISRLSFLAEMLLASAASAWLIRRARREARANGLRTALQYAPRALRATAFAFAGVFLCGALGFMNLASLMGDALLAAAYSAIFLYALTQILQSALALVLRTPWLRALHSVSDQADWVESRLRGGIALLGFGAWALVVLEFFALRRPLWSGVGAALGAELALGSLEFSLGDVLAFALTIAIAVLLARTAETVLDRDVYPRLSIPRGRAYAFSTLLRYGLVTLGLMAAVSALGFGTDRLTVLIGAFGVGIGFGLQTIVNNFVSGLILLFERPVQIGDAIEVAGTLGKVQRIGIRATVVRTYDGSDVTIPNGQLLSERLSNWTLSDRHRRIEVPVGVAYGTEPDRVLELLRGVAAELPGLLSTPEPVAVFRGFGDSSLDFGLYAWVEDNDTWMKTRSELVRGIHRALEDAQVEIPFPQRDLHLRTGPAPQQTRPDEPHRGSEPSCTHSSRAPG